LRSLVFGVAGERGWELRQGLVGDLIREGRVRSARVEAALRAVPREVFVPGVPLEEVYRPSEAIVIKRLEGVSVSSASAPDVMAVMLEQLAVEPGQRVLEIGAGTGYNAALLSELVGPDGEVVSVEIDEDLVLAARDHLRVAGYARVHVVLGDGALGYAPAAPFDRVILTVGAGDIAPAWRDQLRNPGGRLVLPLAITGSQRCVAFDQMGDHLASRAILNCSFIPLRGLLAGATPRVPLGPNGEMAISSSFLHLSAGGVTELLSGAHRTVPTGVEVSTAEVAEGLILWLAAREPGMCSIWASASPGVAEVVPELFGSPDKWRASLGLLADNGLALLAWARAHPPADGAGDELVVRMFGTPGYRLVERVQAWHAAGRPLDAGLSIRAYPRDQTASGEAVVEQRWTRFVLDWNLANS
jgi:protein-L-isoaspartate(D-aspartate) O-methyltransferase